ncbi:MAG: hypothetical protein IEMM0008_0892 [bacterium]|nr:MAG: hypothetical protein IEMM0008_0892 [bacterium]
MVNNNSLYDRLLKELGGIKVRVREESLEEYREDMTEITGHSPDIVVSPTCREDILCVVGIARDTKTPIIPVMANTNMGGLAIPGQGGIILDLKGMNRILEINEEDLYMVIEPGVTFGDVKEYLDTCHPSLRFAYPLSPPYTSVTANCLLDGLSNLSLRYGPMGEWINGMEAVLSNGDVIKTGSGAFSPMWCSNSPLPDLSGLFLNFQGTTGIVTKLSVQLIPKLKHRKKLFILGYDVDHTYSLIKRLTRDNLFDDIGGLSWPLGKMLFGVKYPVYKDPDEPLILIFLDLSSSYEKEMSLKVDILNDILKEYRKKGAHFEDPFDINVLMKINPEFKKFADLPATLDFLLDHGGGGLTWVGTYGPMSQWEKGIKLGMKLLEEMGFTPVMVSRPMRGGHFCVLRFIILFNKQDPQEAERIRELNLKLCNAVMELGFIPYKTPPWVVDLMKDRLDPTFQKWVNKVQTLLDPYSIMNPGKWDVS